jgi:hypothetical protein
MGELGSKMYEELVNALCCLGDSISNLDKKKNLINFYVDFQIEAFEGHLIGEH